MKVAILSDIHDHIWHLRAALQSLKDIDQLVCCGDLCSPFVMAELGRNFSGDIHLVFGNNDADLFRITRIAGTFGDRIHLYGEMGTFTLGRKSFVINHFNNIATEIAAAGKYDVVCFGHNHRREVSQLNTEERNIVVINPGPVMGVAFEGGQPVEVKATFALYDTESHTVSWREINKQTLEVTDLL